MTARDLCAPLDLCRRIPKNEFRDTCFVWYRFDDSGDDMDDEPILREDAMKLEPGNILCPAVTLAEVLREMDKGGWEGWEVFATSLTAASALDAWLEAKGGA